MHRIEGLAEHFVYFNDDMFLIRDVSSKDFFKDGLPCDCFVLDCIYFEPNSAGSYNGNNLELINKNFNKDEQFKKYKSKYFKMCYGLKNLYRTFVLSKWHWFPGFKYDHLPSSFLKSTLEEVWEKEYKILDSTCSDKFRSKRNVNRWLFKYWQFASGNFSPRNYKFGLVFHLKNYPNIELRNTIVNQEYSVICINDTNNTKDFEKYKEMVKRSFYEILRDESSFEN